MALALDDVVSLSIWGTLFGQRIITVLHYAVSVVSAGSTEDQLKQFANDWVSGTGSVPGSLDHMLEAQGIEYTCDYVRAQRVSPTRTIFMQWNSNDVGTHADPCTTANIAISLQKRTATPGRKGVGRVQLAGIPQTGYADGSVNPVYEVAKLLPWCTDLMSSFTTSAGPVTFVPVLYNPTNPTPHYSPLIQVLPESTVRTMHRRTLRVGI